MNVCESCVLLVMSVCVALCCVYERVVCRKLEREDAVSLSHANSIICFGLQFFFLNRRKRMREYDRVREREKDEEGGRKSIVRLHHYHYHYWCKPTYAVRSVKRCY